MATAGFTVDVGARQALRNGSEVRLTPTEGKILEVLTATPGRLVPHRELLERVWGPAYVEETQYLRVYPRRWPRERAQNLSRPWPLVAEPGLGYGFDP